ncbi:hypothetical protein [Sphingobium sp. WCS2017Hpa-17]|uniref:hypothetical protein n=1 Tax=Sphingobium sp. WCS2017Hpa-17 TaxID=3073638 RepID=UPI00288B587C|nr:hypothetical protein [Sphingobium sp. WCS2017Hpa-17]
MAIKVTKRGSLPEHDLFAGTCHRCKTEVEFERQDARFTDDQRDGGYLTVPCPTCRDNISVQANRPKPPAPSR